MVRCKTQQRTCVTRNVMVSANVPNRAAAKRSNALTYGEATMVSIIVPNRAAAICVSAQCKCASKKMCLPDGK